MIASDFYGIFVPKNLSKAKWHTSHHVPQWPIPRRWPVAHSVQATTSVNPLMCPPMGNIISQLLVAVHDSTLAKGN